MDIANEVMKFYNKAPSIDVNSINDKARNISNMLCISDKVCALYEKEAFLKVKEYKDDFHLSFLPSQKPAKHRAWHTQPSDHPHHL